MEHEDFYKTKPVYKIVYTDGKPYLHRTAVPITRDEVAANLFKQMTIHNVSGSSQAMQVKERPALKGQN